MKKDIKLTTETHIANRLSDLVADHTFLPYVGLTGDDEELEPPFTIIAIPEPEKVVGTEGTWFARGTCQVVCHIDEQSGEHHSKLLQKIYTALGNLKPHHEASFIFHGIDVEKMESAQDEDLNAYADIIRFTCGVSG